MEDLNEITKEMKYKIITNKNNEMDLIFRNYNNEELSISLSSSNIFFPKKFELRYNLEEFQRNRFFKIFVNIDEIMKELNNKIKKSTFIEQDNLIIINVKIELVVIKKINKK